MHCDYIHDALDADLRENAVNLAIKRLKGIDFDSIAVRGMSGAIFGGALGHATHKGVVVVRKDGDDSHSGYKCEGPTPKRYVIVDDFIASGATVQSIIERVKKTFSKAKLVGIYLYSPVSGPAIFTPIEEFGDHTYTRRFVKKRKTKAISA